MADEQPKKKCKAFNYPESTPDLKFPCNMLAKDDSDYCVIHEPKGEKK